jgi:hypothetical protein
MSNLTRRFKKNKKNRTIKTGGAYKETRGPYEEKSEPYQERDEDEEINQEKRVQYEERRAPYQEREGIIEILGNKMKNVASAAASTIADTGLKIIGLERIKNPTKYDEQISDSITSKENSNSSVIPRKTYNNDSNFGYKVLDIMDKTGGIIFNDINDLLTSDELKTTTREGAEQTAEIIKDSAKRFNEALNNPDVRAEVEEAIKKAGEISDMVVKYGEKPFNHAVDVAAKATQKATSAAVTGAVRVGTDALSAVPFVGAVVDVGKMVNDTSKAASAITEAGSDMVQATSDAIIETNKLVSKNLSELEEKKKMSQQISNRINNSINDFENPIVTQTTGGRRTRRRLFKRNAKSKRVRFAI